MMRRSFEDRRRTWHDAADLLMTFVSPAQECEDVLMWRALGTLDPAGLIPAGQCA